MTEASATGGLYKFGISPLPPARHRPGVGLLSGGCRNRQDRGAALGICPVFAAASPAETTRQFHLEFRATDAEASPYLALGAMIFAGSDGLRRSLPLPPPNEKLHALPSTLPEALDALAASEAALAWFGPTFLDAYLRFKLVEAEKTASLPDPELCAQYAEVY